jgi:hypothetical protein
MLKKIARDILIIAGVLIMAASTSRTFMQKVSEKRIDREEWWGVHKPVEGDLVAMSYLGFVDKFLSPRDYYFTKHPVDSSNTDLYIYGDSHIWKIPDTAYAAVNKFTYVWRGNADLVYTLDTSRNNILLIEITERYLRDYFSRTEIFDHVKKEQATAAIPHDLQLTYSEFKLPYVEDIFNPNINQNIEFNLFNYNIINPVRKTKAYLSYRLFNRASGDVVIAKDGSRLFLKETVQGRRVENSYYPVSDEEINNMVANINAINDHYRQEGFDEVYLSIIPNPATNLQPEGRNNLIPRLETNAALKIKLISMYDLFEHAPPGIHRPGDTHWSNAGLQIWLSEVNKMLLSER